MSISNREAVALAFIPGVIETLERAATVKGNLALLGVATGVKDARNAFYASVALTTLAALVVTGVSLETSSEKAPSEKKSDKEPKEISAKFTFSMFATVGVGLMTFTANKLYNSTVVLRDVINSTVRS